MPSPVAHSLAGLAVLWLFRILPRTPAVAGRYAAVLAAMAVIAVAADFDFIPELIDGRPGSYHRGVTHSFGAAVIVGALAVGVARWRRWGSPGWIGLVVTAVYASHVVLDLLTVDYGDQIGMPAFWPVSGEAIVSPVHLFLYIRRSASAGDFVSSLFSMHNLSAVAWELVVMGVVLVLLHLAGLGPRRRPTRPATP